MNYFIVDTLFGSFLLDESSNVKNVVSFGTDTNTILAKIEEYAKKPIELYSALIPSGEFKNDVVFVVETDALVSLIKQILPCEVQLESPSKGGQHLRENLLKLISKDPFHLSVEASISLCREVNLNLSRNGIKSLSTQADQQVKQAIETIDDIDKSANLFASRLREWYGLHFPELTDNLIADHLLFAKLVLKLGNREQFTQANLISQLNLNDTLSASIASRALNSMGAEVTERDISAIQRFAQSLVSVYELRTQTERYIEGMMSIVAPNIQALVGSLVGARLISLAGGLKALALKPASTIQILGAEKALFRSLKSPSATSPKHGVIFQWPPLRTAKFWLRGKIARAVAGKLAIAVKADFFTGNFVGDDLAADVRKRMADIEKKYPEPPKQDARQPPKKREGGYPPRGGQGRGGQGRGGQGRGGQGRGGRSYQKKQDRSSDRDHYGNRPNRPPNRPRPHPKGGNA